jgi:hypothetical protein
MLRDKKNGRDDEGIFFCWQREIDIPAGSHAKMLLNIENGGGTPKKNDP